jgi:hypothetical protein
LNPTADISAFWYWTTVQLGRRPVQAHNAGYRTEGAIVKQLQSFFAAFLTALLLILATQNPSAAQPASAEDAELIAQEAYIYLYPLITMDVTRKQSININSKDNPIGGPANAFSHVRAFPTAESRTVVRPNFDTLYSSAWIVLS